MKNGVIFVSGIFGSRDITISVNTVKTLPEGRAGVLNTFRGARAKG